MGSKGAKNLLDCLKINSSLTALELCLDFFDQFCFCFSFFSHIFEYIAENERIRKRQVEKVDILCERNQQFALSENFFPKTFAGHTLGNYLSDVSITCKNQKTK